jgi:hypothetical protein
MSRGIGKTQRLILAVLAVRAGGDLLYGARSDVRWPLGVHDMSEVVRIIGEGKELSERCSRYSSGDQKWLSWRASYSRAVRGLVRDGYLQAFGLEENQRFTGLSVKEKSLTLTAQELETARLWNQKREAWHRQRAA